MLCRRREARQDSTEPRNAARERSLQGGTGAKALGRQDFRQRENAERISLFRKYLKVSDS